jgi:GTP-binding nuclear protein Ran
MPWSLDSPGIFDTDGPFEKPKLIRSPVYINRTVILVGDTGVGKTSFVKRHLTNEFDTNILPSFDAPSFFTTKGILKLEMNESNDVDSWNGASAAIVMFDFASAVSYGSVKNWVAAIKSKMGSSFPIVVCGNKIESSIREVDPKKVQQDGIQVFDISVKTGYNVDKPILTLIKSFLGDDCTYADIRNVDTAHVNLVHDVCDVECQCRDAERDTDCFCGYCEECEDSLMDSILNGHGFMSNDWMVAEDEYDSYESCDVCEDSEYLGGR